MSTYRITYEIHNHPEGINRKDVPEGRGATDALLICSLLYPDDGSLSMLMVSRDGRTGKDLTDEELFKVWMLMASRLSDSTTLSEGKRMFAGRAFDAIRSAILAIENKKAGSH